MSEELKGQFGIIGMEDDGQAEYQLFTDKFKPKKTTDDCYTPENIHAAILHWAAERYGFSESQAMRPFWPGADYTEILYPPGCVVVDNPPFSKLTEIQRYYQKRKIPFFLYAPALTVLTRDPGITALAVGADIRYENGAIVPTSFRTNMSPDVTCQTAPDLKKIINTENQKNLPPNKKNPKYVYPENVIHIGLLARLSSYDVPYTLYSSECSFVSKLDSQKSLGKSIFGGGFLLSTAAAAAAPAVKWELSQKEKDVIQLLDDRKGLLE